MLDPNSSDHLIAMTQLQEQLEATKKQVSTKEQQLLEKDKKVGYYLWHYFLLTHTSTVTASYQAVFPWPMVPINVLYLNSAGDKHCSQSGFRLGLLTEALGVSGYLCIFEHGFSPQVHFQTSL